MKRWLAISLFAAALLAFWLVGHLERRHSRNVLESAITSVDTQLNHETAGTATPANRTEFLKSQKRLLGSIRSPEAPRVNPSPPQAVGTPTPSPSVASFMPMIITAVFALVSFWIVLSKGYKPDEEARKWAFGTLGLIIGYWLKG
jgi:hypothetical protein